MTYVPAKNNGTLDESNVGYRFTFTLVEFFQRPIFGKLVYLYTVCFVVLVCVCGASYVADLRPGP